MVGKFEEKSSRTESHKMSQIARANNLAKSGEIELAKDVLYDYLDEMVLSCDFRSLNDVFSQLDVSKMHTAIITGILYATKPCKTKLPNRKRIVMQARQAIGEDATRKLE